MKQEIEELLVTNERILQLWTAEDALDESKGKHLKIKVKKEKIDSVYDVDEVIVELLSDTPMSIEVQIRTIMEAMRQLEADPRIRKVVYCSHTLTEDPDETKTKRYGEVVFTVVSTIDK